VITCEDYYYEGDPCPWCEPRPQREDGPVIYCSLYRRVMYLEDCMERCGEEEATG